MKLFDKFEAVKFREEDLILVAHDGYVYYIYDSKYNKWKNCRNTVLSSIFHASNYPDVDKEELLNAMNGAFPERETDFMRLCHPSELCIRDMLDILGEDYEKYMSDYTIFSYAQSFLIRSNICYKSYEKLRQLLGNAITNNYDREQVLSQIKNLSLEIIGKDIFDDEIRIVDGHDGSSYFWIMPVRVIDYSNTNEIDNVAEMKNMEISIEEDDVYQYLYPFIKKYFDDSLKANKQRINDSWIDDNGQEHVDVIAGFEWYLTHNFFTFDSIKLMLNDIVDTINSLNEGIENEYTQVIKGDDNVDVKLIVDFYNRFIYRMGHMINIGKENGYDLISFMGP